MTQIERRQTWRQKKDQTLVAIRDASNSTITFCKVDDSRVITSRPFTLPVDEFLSKFSWVPTPDELDSEWKRLADEGDDFTRNLSEKLEEVARSYESYLRSLRKYAELQLEKKAAK